MAENLNYETDNSFCYNSANCSKYGRLYTWAAATAACPQGWHLPTQLEWDTLFTEVGGSSTAGTKLKSTSGWYNTGNGKDAFGFSALPAGLRNDDGSYGYVGRYAYFWSSTEDDSNNHAFYMYLYYYYGDACLGSRYNHGYSVRCVKD